MRSIVRGGLILLAVAIVPNKAGEGAIFAKVSGLQRTFASGETLDYDLSWLGMTGGSARMTIGVAPDDASHLRMTSIARSSSAFARIYRVRDEMQSLVNRNTFSTIRYDKHLDERGRKKDDTTVVDESRNLATRHRPGKIDEMMKVTKPVFDPLSLIYHLRVLNLTGSTTHRFTVLADGKVYILEADVGAPEVVETALGTMQAIPVQPKLLSGGLFRDEDSRLTIWYSDDDRRIPVRIRSELKLGIITATIRSVRSGVNDVEPGGR